MGAGNNLYKHITHNYYAHCTIMSSGSQSNCLMCCSTVSMEGLSWGEWETQEVMSGWRSRHTPSILDSRQTNSSDFGNVRVTTSQASTPKLYTSILVVCCGRGCGECGDWGNASGAVYRIAPSPGVVASRARFADPKSESLASHLSLGRERRRTLAELTSLWMTGSLCRWR